MNAVICADPENGRAGIGMDIAAGLGALKGAFDLAQSIGTGLTQAALNDLKIALQNKILEGQRAAFDLQQDHAAMLERERNLEAEIARLKDWSAERERYSLHRYYPGVVAYALKPGMERGEPPVKLCANCYTRGEKSFLQATAELANRERIHRCDTCGSKVAIGGEMAGE